MTSFWSFPQIPKGPQGKEALMIVPLLFGAFVLIVVGQLLYGWLAPGPPPEFAPTKSAEVPADRDLAAPPP